MSPGERSLLAVNRDCRRSGGQNQRENENRMELCGRGALPRLTGRSPVTTRATCPVTTTRALPSPRDAPGAYSCSFWELMAGFGRENLASACCLARVEAGLCPA
jgi:hypothetical protein